MEAETEAVAAAGTAGAAASVVGEVAVAAAWLIPARPAAGRPSVVHMADGSPARRRMSVCCAYVLT